MGFLYFIVLPLIRAPVLPFPPAQCPTCTAARTTPATRTRTRTGRTPTRTRTAATRTRTRTATATATRTPGTTGRRDAAAFVAALRPPRAEQGAQVTHFASRPSRR